MKLQTKESIGLIGKYALTLAECSSREAKHACDTIKQIMQFDRCEALALIRLFNARFGLSLVEATNLLPTVGRALIANNLTDAAPANDPYANYIAVGTNAAAPTNGDTTLGTELARVITSSSSNSNNIAYITGFFGYTEGNGTLKEAGIFCDGTGAADSGVLLSHVAIDIVKSTGTTLTLDWTLTIN